MGTPLPPSSEERPLLFHAVEKSTLRDWMAVKERLLGLNNKRPVECRNGRTMMAERLR